MSGPKQQSRTTATDRQRGTSGAQTAPKTRRGWAADSGYPYVGAVSNEAVDDPDGLARQLLYLLYTHERGAYTLCYHREIWYCWDAGAYFELTPQELRSGIHTLAKVKFDEWNKQAIEEWKDCRFKGVRFKGDMPRTIKVNRTLILNVEEAIRALVIVPSVVSPPAWIDEVDGPINILTMDNGLLDPDAHLAKKTRVLRAHTPSWFTTTKFPHIYKPHAKCPKWLAFLEMNLEGDAERIAILQEWFGYCLTHDTSLHKFLVLEGDGANGKSVVCAALEATLGRDNCSFVPLELFGERFQLAPTIGKLANIIPECGEIDRVAEGFLKSFVSGDGMTFDRKNKAPLQCAPTARILLAMNTRPRFSDRSSGLWRRMIVMPMSFIVPEDERIKNMDKPAWWHAQGELPGIFNWALAGLARLRNQGRFTSAKVCEDALTDYRLESNPARLFLQEKCREDPEADTVMAVLYESYRKWAIDNGYSPLANGKFGAEVKRAFPKMRKGQSAKKWIYFGLYFDQFGS